MSPKLKKYSVIGLTIILLFTMSIGVFASPGEIDSTSQYNKKSVPDFGYIEVQTINYMGYHVDTFTLGDIESNMYPFGDFTIDNISSNGDWKTARYNFGYACQGVRFHMPVAFFNMSSGQIVPNTFSTITFNTDVHCHVEFTVLESGGQLTNIVQDYDILSGSQLTWLTDIPSGTQTVLNYTMLVTFSNSYVSNLKMTYGASFTESYKNNLAVLVANNNYQGGYNQGIIDGERIGYDKGYIVGREDGALQNPLSGFGNFFVTTIGGLFDTPLFGTITIGGVLTTFVGFSVCIWLLKLLAGG